MRLFKIIHKGGRGTHGLFPNTDIYSKDTEEVVWTRSHLTSYLSLWVLVRPALTFTGPRVRIHKEASMSGVPIFELYKRANKQI